MGSKRKIRKIRHRKKKTCRSKRQKGGRVRGELFPWIIKDKLNWRMISSNPNAIAILENNQDKIDWKQLSRNPAAIHLLEQNPTKINWSWLSLNTSPLAFEMLKNNPDKIDYDSLSSNTSPEALPLLEQKMMDDPGEEINWALICENPVAGKLVDKYLEINPDAINTLDWNSLSLNPSAINVLRKNIDKINWAHLSLNTALFDDTDSLHGVFLSSDETPTANRGNIMYRIPPEISRMTIEDYL